MTKPFLILYARDTKFLTTIAHLWLARHGNIATALLILQRYDPK